MDGVSGEFVTETFAYDGGRQVTVYVPPDPPAALVFAGDGQLISRWGAALEAADVPSTMIVGVHRPGDETLRLDEYSPRLNPERFAAHERFFVEEVRRWTRSRFGVAMSSGRTAVYGVSASGELALAIGLRHPDIYGVVFCASPGGGYRPPAAMPRSLPRSYLVAGTLEPFLLENATRWATALRDAGADVVMTERVGSPGERFSRLASLFDVLAGLPIPCSVMALRQPLKMIWRFGGVWTRLNQPASRQVPPVPAWRGARLHPRPATRRFHQLISRLCLSLDLRLLLLPPRGE